MEEITIDKTIEIFEGIKKGIYPWYPEPYYDMAINTMRKYQTINALEPTTKNNLGVDCISRAQIQTEIEMSASRYTIAKERGGMGKVEWSDQLIKVSDAVDIIRNLPSVTPQEARWIPVSERLPKTFEFVNCTCHSLIDDREDWVVETCYVPQPRKSPYSDWGNIPMLNHGDCEVVAWMHRRIPKPYKAESEG